MRILRLLPILLLGFGVTAHAQSQRAIKDWVGACDNTRQCTAIGLSPESNEGVALLYFERAGGANDQITRIRLRFDLPPNAAAGKLLADGKPLLTLTARHFVNDPNVGAEIRIEDRAEIATVFAAMRSASQLSLDAGAGTSDAVSLSGASAVMLWIDEQQGRLGTTSALVRRGDATSSAIVPPAPRVVAQVKDARALEAAELATISASVRAALPADSCEEINPDLPLADAGWRLDAQTTLVQLVCFSGAYNVGSQWFFQRGSAAAQRLRLPVPNADGSGRMDSLDELINADFDPATGMLGHYNKGRGIGDCGSEARWAFDGKRFQLAHYAAIDECRGVNGDLWPVLWRTRQ